MSASDNFLNLITHKQIHRLFENFSGKHAMVIGDVMVDAYLYGNVERISPEAPVPIVALNKRVNMLGGAANVALNVKALGAIPLLFSVTGNDQKGREFLELLEKENLSTEGIIACSNRITTTKFRIIGNKSQMLRVDEEIVSDLIPETENLLMDKIIRAFAEHQIHVLIFQDYNKGVITKSIIEKVIALAKEKGVPVVVDPKKKNFDAYHGVKLFKPNFKELREGLKTDFPSSDKKALHENIAILQEKQHHEIIMVTMSDEGMIVRFKTNGQHLFHSQAAFMRSISDVSGAGDTVISVAALCVATGIEIPLMAFLANLAGGIVCEYVGVVPINKNRLLHEALALTNSDK